MGAYIPVIAVLPPSTDWTVEKITDLFHTTYKVKTNQVTKCRGQRCGDIEIEDYLACVVVVVSFIGPRLVYHTRSLGE